MYFPLLTRPCVTFGSFKQRDGKHYLWYWPSLHVRISIWFPNMFSLYISYPRSKCLSQNMISREFDDFFVCKDTAPNRDQARISILQPTLRLNRCLWTSEHIYPSSPWSACIVNLIEHVLLDRPLLIKPHISRWTSIVNRERKDYGSTFGPPQQSYSSLFNLATLITSAVEMHWIHNNVGPQRSSNLNPI